MAQVAGFNIPGTGNIPDNERVVASLHVKLVQAVNSARGFQTSCAKPNETSFIFTAGIG